MNVFLLQYQALSRRMMAGFLSDLPVADLVEFERQMAAQAFTGPLEDVGFIDLTDRLHEEGLYEQINEASFSPWTSRGRIFGIPHDMHPVMLAYRADLVEAAGIDVTNIETWDDFARELRPLIEDLDGDGLFGIAWDRLTLDHFRRLHTGLGFAGNVLNSFFLASVTSVLATLCSAMGGYALAKFRFRGDGVILFCMFTALVIPGALLLAPSYQLLYWFRLLDTFPGLIVPVIAPAFGIYLFRQATLHSVPSEMIEAARIDGCGEIPLFFTIVLPMVRPMIGAFLIITHLGTWNSFIWPQIVMQSPENFPLAVAVAQLRGIYSQDYGMIMAGTLVSIAPVLILFLMLQREFISGLTAGAVKG